MSCHSRPGRTLVCCTLTALALASCGEPDEFAELEEFRSEIGSQASARVVIARMYQRGKWMIREVQDAPRKDKIAYVCKAIAALNPTYVSGLVRLDHDDKVTDEMLEVYAGVKKCIRDEVKQKTDRKVRFDIVLNALHYTSEHPDKGADGGITSRKQGLDLLKDRIKTANALDPDGYFFDFYSIPWKGKLEDGPYHPDVLADGTEFIQGQGRFVGGNIWGGFIPPGADLVSITDRGGFEHVREQMQRILDGGDKPPVPTLMHIRNDPHIEGSEGRVFLRRDTRYRKQVLRRHVRWQDQGYIYMYPVYFPLYKPEDAHAYDAGDDGNILDRMIDYLGPPDAKGSDGKEKLPAVSDEDAVFTEFDAADDGLIAVHRARHADSEQHLYSGSLLELDEGPGLTIEAEGYFSLARTPAPGTVPLHRCDLGGGAHLYTTDAACEGAGVDEGALGHIATVQLPGTVPLHRLVHPGRADHLFTTSAPERDAAIADGYAYETIAGYVWDEAGLAVADLPPAPDPMDPAAACAPPLRPVYKGYHAKRGQHLFAVNHDELLVPGMTDEGVAFNLKPAPAPDARWIPFFRCLLPQSWHLLTADPGCEGVATAKNEGSLGNLATAALPGTVPVYRYFHAAADGKNDHFYAVGHACETIPGYTCEGAVGHVCPP